MSQCITVTDATFRSEVFDVSVPVVAVFADSTPESLESIRTVEEVMSTYGGAISLAKVNVPANRTVGVAYGITKVPTIILFVGGKAVLRMVGVATAEQLRAAVHSYVS